MMSASGILMVGLLSSLTIIQCQVIQRFSSLPIGAENTVTVEKKNATELVFSSGSFDKTVSHYFWEVKATLDNLNDDLANQVEIFLSNEEHVEVFKLPHFQNLPSKKVHFCHTAEEDQTEEGILRIIMNTRSVTPVKVKLTVNILSSEEWITKENYNLRLSLSSESQVSLSEPALKELLSKQLARFPAGEKLRIDVDQQDDQRCFKAEVKMAGCANQTFKSDQRYDIYFLNLSL